MFVLDFVFILFRIIWWPYAGKELSPWLSAAAVFILCCLNCMRCFPVRCLWNSNVWVPNHCLFIYFDTQGRRDCCAAVLWICALQFYEYWFISVWPNLQFHQHKIVFSCIKILRCSSLLSVKTENYPSYVWSIAPFNIDTKIQSGLSCHIASCSRFPNMQWAAIYFYPRSLEHEKYYLDTF